MRLFSSVVNHLMYKVLVFALFLTTNVSLNLISGTLINKYRIVTFV